MALRNFGGRSVGQEKPVFIYHFLVKDTIEEKIYELQQKKTELSSGVLDGLNQSGRPTIENQEYTLY